MWLKKNETTKRRVYLKLLQQNYFKIKKDERKVPAKKYNELFPTEKES
jgi:hypothetical protein